MPDSDEQDPERNPSVFTKLARGIIPSEEKGNELEEVMQNIGGTRSSTSVDEATATIMQMVRALEGTEDIQYGESETVGGDDPSGPAVQMVEMRDGEHTLGVRIMVDTPPQETELLLGTDKVVVRGPNGEKDVETPFRPHAMDEDHPENGMASEFIVTPVREALPA